MISLKNELIASLSFESLWVIQQVHDDDRFKVGPFWLRQMQLRLSCFVIPSPSKQRSSSRDNNSEALGRSLGSGCIIALMILYRVGGQNRDSWPLRMPCHSLPQLGSLWPRHNSYRVAPREKMSHWQGPTVRKCPLKENSQTGKNDVQLTFVKSRCPPWSMSLAM